MKLVRISALCLLISLLSALTSLAGAPPTPGSVLRAQPFALTDVRLLDSSFKSAMERDAAYLLDLAPDRLLHTFRKNAGLPSQTKSYGGWEAETCELRGHFVGHYLSACALMFASTGDERFRERAALLVRELARCQAALGASGYLSAFPESFIDRVEAGIKVWAPWYTLHKILAGLIEIHTHCGNAQALEVARRFGHWVAARTGRLGDDAMQKMLAIEHGGMLEAMADLYALTGEEEFLLAARRFHHRQVFEPLVRGEDRLAGLHANTQVPKITGAARLYELTGEKRYRTMAEFFWDRVVNHHSYVNGGNSDREHFGPPDHLEHRCSPWTAETCNTHNMLRLTRHLFAWNPSAESADYYERALYNQILASQDPRTGMMAYHIPVRGAWYMPYKSRYDAFWCCTGSGVENHAKYGDSIYWHDAEGLYVNLFIASELQWRDEGISVRQETRFPETEATRLIIGTRKPVTLNIRIRRPAWVGAMSILVNGEPVVLPSERKERGRPTGGYIEIRREWRNGDRIDVRLPMSLRLEPLPGDAHGAAICYGPVVLAGALGGDGIAWYLNWPSAAFHRKTAPSAPVFLAQGLPLTDWIEAVPGRPLTFRTKGVGRPTDVTLVAFHLLPPQRYSIYWDLLPPEGWEPRSAALEASENRERRLSTQAVDVVGIGNFEHERAHKVAGERSETGILAGRLWRGAAAGGFFSYEMKVPSGVPAILVCTYRSGDRRFDVLVDGEKIATQRLEEKRPGELFDVEYPIPAALTAKKDRVTVKFQAHPRAATGGLFGLWMLQGE